MSRVSLHQGIDLISCLSANQLARLGWRCNRSDVQAFPALIEAEPPLERIEQRNSAWLTRTNVHAYSRCCPGTSTAMPL